MIPLVEFKNVVKSFGAKLILDGVSFQVSEGETFCLVGGSGTGKSVTLKLLLGLIPIDEGDILFRGQSIVQADEDELNAMRLKMGMLFQGGALFDSMTVFENVAYPLEEQHTLSEDEIQKTVLEKLAVVGLERVEELYPADLSGGMLKRVALARAIVASPKVILYDEPTSGLDPTNLNRIDELIIDLKTRLKVSSIVVTHHMPSVFKIADRVALLANKKIVFMGTVSSFAKATDPLVKEFIEGSVGEERVKR